MATPPTTDELLRNGREFLRMELSSLALDQAEAVLANEPESKDALLLKGDVLLKANDNLAAANIFERLTQLDPRSAEYAGRATNSLMLGGSLERALDHAETFKKLSNGWPGALLMISNIHERSGNTEQAWEAIHSAPLGEEFVGGVASLAPRLLMQEKKYGEAIDVIKNYLDWAKTNVANPEANDSPVVDAWFMLAKAYDRLGEYDQAWESAATAHDISDVTWDSKSNAKINQTICDLMTHENVRALAHASEHHEEPVFIVGNPRSGTSLLEQILSMHPEVENAGELVVSASVIHRASKTIDSFNPYPACLVDMRVEDANAMARQYMDATKWMTSNPARITNKSLSLHNQAGFLSLILPKSRMIMLHRHPLDNCISCYTTNLVATRHHYTNQLKWLAQMWIQRHELQEYWTQTLEIEMMDLHYDKLVVDQENETRKLLEFLGLSWEDACLNFHKSKRVAATISYDQVNKKMYTSSSGRWKNYEKHIGPLIDALGDYL